MYHYAENNPIKYIDPDGRGQTPEQKYIENYFSALGGSNPRMAELIREGTSIQVTRSSNDNGMNGTYYQSQLSVNIMNVNLNNLQVQSTADYLPLGHGNVTLPALAAKSVKYCIFLILKNFLIYYTMQENIQMEQKK